MDFDYKKHYCVGDYEGRGEVPTDTPSLVDVKGYIPMRKQVERAILAGERLVAFRREEFDSMDENYDGEPSELMDPDFMPSVDMPAIIDGFSEKIERFSSERATQRSVGDPEELQRNPSEPAPDNQ